METKAGTPVIVAETSQFITYYVFISVPAAYVICAISLLCTTAFSQLSLSPSFRLDRSSACAILRIVRQNNGGSV